jgi:hypothetical protein
MPDEHDNKHADQRQHAEDQCDCKDVNIHIFIHIDSTAPTTPQTDAQIQTAIDALTASREKLKAAVTTNSVPVT